ncbi:pilus assembly protein TadB [Noviherbaspirillum saxi]|uniref:Pilus assembly protein TadB n=2 Tax=Noviherbaspirillum saxi TaxID=2320863 RepID=A0A3A3FI73_9BURK|nr:pilus assembly protein TadB [Noviherbaspirillum saxi]
MWWTATRGDAAKRIERRLQLLSAGTHRDSEDLSILKQRFLSQSPAMDRLLWRVPRIHALDRMLQQSGLGWTVSRFLVYSTITFATGTILGMVLHAPFLVAILAGSCFSTIPAMVVTRARAKRLTKFEEQLPEAADLISRALRAGSAFPATLQMVRDEMPEPISGEFRIAFDEINYGVPMTDALMNLATRIPLTDLRYFVIAVLIQRESGGNLAEILGNISQIIRARLKLFGQIRVLSAEGRLSAWILGILPFAVAGAIVVINPKFITVLWSDPAGVKLMWIAAGMMLAGFIWMRKIIRIHV